MMKAHIERLPEYYPLKDESFSFVNWLSNITPVNRLPEDEKREETKTMTVKRVLVIDDEAKIIQLVFVRCTREGDGADALAEGDTVDLLAIFSQCYDDII